MDAAIYKANEKMTFLTNDKEVLRLYHMREMAQIDYNSGMRKAKEDGSKMYHLLSLAQRDPTVA